MGFVNEIISEEDAKKFDLNSVWRSVSLNKNAVPDLQGGWTIDRERNVFFVPVYMDREEFSNQTHCALWWDGVLVKVKLNQHGVTTSREGNRDWELVEIFGPQTCDVSEDEIKNVLKEALLVYGYAGIYRQIPNYVVTFRF